MTERPAAGVVGVGSMGRHHVRVYDELSDVDLVGVTDQDEDRAASVADEYGTRALSRRDLFAAADVVSVAVPTRYHDHVARAAIDAGVSVLVEKPFVADPERGRALTRRAERAGVTLQVGHIEQFNPAVQALRDVVSGMDVIALEARRLGPPVTRDSKDGVVLDLMIHDIDLALSLVDSDVASVSATRARDSDHVVAQLGFGNGVVADLTASRVTQEKVRELAVTAEEGWVTVDYASQSLRIHRQSIPEYYDDDGSLGQRTASVTERPTVDNEEPLKRELRSFVESHRTGTEPAVTGRDGVRAVELARRIEELVSDTPAVTVEP
jgi:predicted dehydrogenase